MGSTVRPLLSPLCSILLNMEEGVKYVNSITEEQFVSLFGNVVEHTAQVAHQLFKVKPFLDSESFLSTMDTVIDSLALVEKVHINKKYLNIYLHSSGPNSQWSS